MKKKLQKIVLFFAVVTVMFHAVLPHLHHNVKLIAFEYHHQDSEELIKQQQEESNRNDIQHSLFSFAQLDENFVPVNSQSYSFELRLTYLSAFLVTYLIDDFPVNIKTPFGCYEVFPPPEKYFSSSSHRGPPTV